jgi:hypothetical protein
VKRQENLYILRALQAADELCCLADDGEAHCVDDGCCVLYGIVRDCAYRIKGRARQEQEQHVLMGKWTNRQGKNTRRKDELK